MLELLQVFYCVAMKFAFTLYQEICTKCVVLRCVQGMTTKRM